MLGGEAPSKAIDSPIRLEATGDRYRQRISEGHAADRMIGKLFASSEYAVSQEHHCQLD